MNRSILPACASRAVTRSSSCTAMGACRPLLWLLLPLPLLNRLLRRRLLLPLLRPLLLRMSPELVLRLADCVCRLGKTGSDRTRYTATVFRRLLLRPQREAAFCSLCLAFVDQVSVSLSVFVREIFNFVLDGGHTLLVRLCCVLCCVDDTPVRALSRDNSLCCCWRASSAIHQINAKARFTLNMYSSLPGRVLSVLRAQKVNGVVCCTVGRDCGDRLRRLRPDHVSAHAA